MKAKAGVSLGDQWSSSLESIPNISRVCEIADKYVTFLIQELL